MSIDLPSVRADLLAPVESLEQEAALVFDQLVVPGWNGPLHGLPSTLYGYVMGVFGHIDLFSTYWRGSGADQPRRMVDFMLGYMWAERETCYVAVQMRRNALMHTGRPRPVFVSATASRY